MPDQGYDSDEESYLDSDQPTRYMPRDRAFRDTRFEFLCSLLMP
jgi:hypothetical protein